MNKAMISKTQKSQALVEITLPPDAKVHAHEYQLYLPSKELLQQKLREFSHLSNLPTNRM